MYVLGLLCGFQGSKRRKCRIKNLVNLYKKLNALSSVSQVKQESNPSFLSAYCKRVSFKRLYSISKSTWTWYKIKSTSIATVSLDYKNISKMQFFCWVSRIYLVRCQTKLDYSIHHAFKDSLRIAHCASQGSATIYSTKLCYQLELWGSPITLLIFISIY